MVAIPFLVSCLLAILTAGPATAQTPAFRIAETSPALTATLGGNEPLYVRIAYESPGPVRFWIEGYSASKEVTDGASTSIHPLYPPGKGEALQWIAYRGSARIDEIRIYAAIGSWTPQATVSKEVDLQWDESAARSTTPAWAERLSREQQVLWQQSTDEEPDSWLGGVIVLLGWISILGYLVLQPSTALKWSGGWRVAALLPLIATVPLIGHALFALAAGPISGRWD